MASPANYLNPSYNTAVPNYLNQDYNSSNPRTIAANALGLNAQTAQTGAQNASQTQSYLNPIEQSYIAGQGGYTPSQVSQIEMTPQQQQNMITSAGISSGTATQAGADAAQRATNAAGGNPEALATYRQRAAQQSGAQAGNAETNAQVAAQQAQAQNVENVGQTQIGQQDVGLGLQSQYQQQQNQNAQNANANAVGNTRTGVSASQTPSQFDQIAGGVAGALPAIGGLLGALDSGAGPESGRPMGYRAYGAPNAQPAMPTPVNRYLDGGGMERRAIVAEKSPEAIVPVPNYMDSGSDMPDMDGYAPPPESVTQSEQTMGTSQPNTPSIWQRIRQQMTNGQAPKATSGAMQGEASTNPGNIGQTIGKGISGGIQNYLNADSGTTPTGMDSIAKGKGGAIVTKPTEVSLSPNEAVVPLKYREKAKARPSMAMPLVNEIQGSKIPTRKPYPGMGNSGQRASA